jgi:LPS-assembly protein
VVSNDISVPFKTRRKYSNILTSAQYSLKDLSFNGSIQYNPQTNTLSNLNSSATYWSNPRKFLTLARHNSNNDISAELYGSHPISSNMHIFAGINQSLTESITKKETVGVAYESCCWALRLAHFKKHLSGNDYDYVTKFELVLKGLASSTPELARRLEKNIPNYLANLDD